MPLDPIVSLSVALAEAPGTCAFFLGSGVSRDAGVPTGQEVMRAGLRRLHQLETTSPAPIGDPELDAWLIETQREHTTYADLLAAITPDPAVRRQYLAGFFEGREPGLTHEALARMAQRGLVRVFVTTNFDRLLEHALQSLGIEPVVIASDADLEATMPREHADCVVLKPHGDYLRDTIRNTPEELAELESAMTAELREVFDRYGVAVLGYSGADEGIGRALRARRSRFGVWWVARGELGQPAAELVEAIAARVIHRESAAEFLEDLERRLAVFDEHPSGITPAAAHDGMLALLRAQDDVGITETLRRDRYAYETELQVVTAEARMRGAPSQSDLEEVWSALRPVLERRLAGLLPLALHDSPRFGAEIGHIARGLERRPPMDGYEWSTRLPEWAATWLGYISGALLVRLDRFDALTPLLETTWSDRNNRAAPVLWLPGDTGDQFGRTLMESGDGRRWLSPAWEFLTRGSVSSLDWFRERYPELVGENEPRRSMAQFDMLLCISYSLMKHRAAALFELGGDAAGTLARRLHRDARLREQVAAALGVSLDEFDKKAPQALRNAASSGGGALDHNDVASILETGSEP